MKIRTLGRIVFLAVLAAIAATVVVFAVGTYRLIFPSYSWNQKLTMTVDTPAGVASGSSVVRVVWSDGPDLLADAPHLRYTYKGEATAVRLGEGKYVFALLSGAEGLALRVLWQRRLPNDADALAFYLQAVTIQEPGNPSPVPIDAFPMLVTFDDIDDPETVRLVDPADFAATFGEGYQLRSLTLEMTQAPPTVDAVAKILPWLKDVWPNRLDGDRFEYLRASNRLANSLSANSFSTAIGN